MFKYLFILNKYTEFLGEHKGLEESQISNIETEFKVKLPNAYKEFLRYFGLSSGNLLASYHMQSSSLKKNRNGAFDALLFDDRVDENKRVHLKETYFFFAEWQGAFHMFFDLSNNVIEDDPPVYALVTSERIDNPYSSFSQFILKEGLIELLEINGVKYEE